MVNGYFFFYFFLVDHLKEDNSNAGMRDSNIFFFESMPAITFT